MAGKSADQLQSDAELQEQVDGVQRGPHLGEVFDASTETFSLSRVTANISNDVRKEVLAVLGEGATDIDNLKTLKSEYDKRIAANAVISTDLARKKEIGLEVTHDFLDDALMDVRVLNKLLADPDNKDVVDFLNKGLQNDVEPPIDASKRPDLVILLRTIFFSVEGDPSRKAVPKDYRDSIKANQKKLIMEVASLPDTPEMDKVKAEIATNKKKSGDLKKLNESLEDAQLTALMNKISDSESDLRDLYDDLGSVTAKIADASTIDANIAQFNAEVEGCKAELSNPKANPTDKANITARLTTAMGNLKTEEAKKAQIELLKKRPQKEKAHRRLLLDLMEKVEAACKETPRIARLAAKSGIATGLTGPKRKLIVANADKFDQVLVLLKQNLNPKKKDNTYDNNDGVFLVYADQINQWLQSSPGGKGTVLAGIQNNLGKTVEDADEKIKGAEEKLAKLKTKEGKGTSYADHDFNINLHTALAQKQNPRLAGLSKKEVEKAVRMNLINDLLDLEENNRVGRSFDAKKRSIIESIDPVNESRFNGLRNISYYEKTSGKRITPLATYNLATTNPDQLFKQIESGDLTPGGAIFLYAALKIANLGNHPNAQLLRREILADLAEKKGDKEGEASKDFKAYVEEATARLFGAEKKSKPRIYTSKSWTARMLGLQNQEVRTPNSEAVIDYAIKRDEKLAKKAARKAGDRSLTDHLEDVAKEKGGLSGWDLTRGMMSQGVYKASPYVLGFGRDATKFAVKNTAGVAWGLTKFAGGVVTTVPGLAINAIGNQLPNLLKPHLLIKDAVKTSVGAVFHPFKTLRTLSGRTEGKLIDASFKPYEKGADLKEKAKKKAEAHKAHAESLKRVHQSYFDVADVHYEWMDFQWGKKPNKSNVVELKPKEEKKDANNGTPLAAAA